MENEDNNDYEPEIIYIPDEEGNEEEFEVVMKFEMDDTEKKYMMVVPMESSEDEEEDEVFAFRYEEDGDDLKLFTIEDEEEWKQVEETFNTLLEADEEEEAE